MLKIFVTTIALISSSSFASDAQLLMYAAQINFMKAVVIRCDQLLPNYTRDFQSAYSKAKANFYDPAGITEALMTEASETPELKVTPLVEKFDRQEIEKRKGYCKHHLQELNTAATMER